MPLIQRIAMPVIDNRTTRICLHVAGQIVDTDEEFETLAGNFMDPPFHIHCRTMVGPWMPGMINNVRKESNAELQRRPMKFRRLGPDGEIGAKIPPPSIENVPESHQFPGAAEAAWQPKVAPKPPTHAERRKLRPGEFFDGETGPDGKKNGPGRLVRFGEGWIYPAVLTKVRDAAMRLNDPQLQQDLLDTLIEYVKGKIIRTLADLPARVLRLLRLKP